MWRNLAIHLALLKGFYYQPKKLGSTQTWILTIINVDILDLQWSFFKFTMLLHNGLWTSPWIWIFCQGFGKNCFAMHCYVHVSMRYEGGKINDGLDYGIYGKWKDFFNTNRCEDKIVKYVYEHLDLVVCLYAQLFYTINNFLYMMPTQHGKGENMKGSFGLKHTLDHGWSLFTAHNGTLT